MTAPVRTLAGLARALGRQWWPQRAALAAASAVVAAAITGALGVGDVIQQGLLRLAVDRLGRIDAAVVSEGFFRQELAQELAAGNAEPLPSMACTPALVLPVTVTMGSEAAAIKATLLACDDPAALGFEPAPPPLEEAAVWLNQPLATSLDASDGSDVVVRLPKRSVVPADSPLGRRTDDAVGRRCRVAGVLPESGLGRFSLRPVQSTEPLVVMSLGDAQRLLREGPVANVVMATGGGPQGAAATLRSRLTPALADYSLANEPVGDGVWRLSSRRLVIPPEVDRAAAEVLEPAGGHPSLVFLANDIVPLKAAPEARVRIPYSTVLGIDSTALPAGPLVAADGATLPVPGPDEIIIDRWMADDFASQGCPVEVGDTLTLRCFRPETIHGRVAERDDVVRVVGIAEMTGAAIDRSLVPDIEGVTDEDSIADWDPPFPFDASRVRSTPPHDEDDRYWKQHRATPKAFVSLPTARKIAAGRFGKTTAWHVAGPMDDLPARLAAAIDPERGGLRVLPLRADAIAASRGSTPFGGLFLALSSFVVAAGLVLVWLLFRLLVAAQGQALGTLAAIGFAPRRLAALLIAVGAGAAAVGIIGGAAVGPLWTRVLVVVLGSAWNRDVAGGSAAVFESSGTSVVAVTGAALATFGLAILAVAVAALRAGRTPPQTLLRSRGDEPLPRPSDRRWSLVVAGACLAIAAAAAIMSRSMPSAAVGLFFVAGFAALAGLLALVRWRFAARAATAAVRTLPGLAARTIAARPGRGFSIAAIVACGQFLIVAVSAFAVRLPSDPNDPHSATGGWTIIARFGEPTSIDPSDAVVRAGLGLTAAEDAALAACRIARLRASDGDDASCTNLYATMRPTVVGVGDDFLADDRFRFVAHAPFDRGASSSPWQLLAGGGEAVPVVLDQATAQWGLKLGGVGSRFSLPDETGQAVTMEIVGLLEPGILQGRVIVNEQQFERLFPSRSGYAMALVDASRIDAAARTALPGALRAAWRDAGVSCELAIDRLAAIQSVQNTFLRGFQALGALGLLLGTAGVAAVQLQGVFERLGSLSVLRAVGFTLARVRALLVAETIVTVGAGLVVGSLAGIIAIGPALVDGSARLQLAWIAGVGGVTLATASAAAWVAVGRHTIPERPRD